MMKMMELELELPGVVEDLLPPGAAGEDGDDGLRWLGLSSTANDDYD